MTMMKAAILRIDKGRIEKGGLIKGGLIKGGLIKGGLIKGGLIKGGLIKGGLITIYSICPIPSIINTALSPPYIYPVISAINIPEDVYIPNEV